MNVSPTQLRKWADIRKDGKTHFAITRGIFGFGFPLLVSWLIYRFCFDNVLERYNIYAILGELCVIIPGTLFFGYRFGRRQWDVREKQFLDACPDGNPPKPELDDATKDA